MNATCVEPYSALLPVRPTHIFLCLAKGNPTHPEHSGREQLTSLYLLDGFICAEMHEL